MMLVPMYFLIVIWGEKNVASMRPSSFSSLRNAPAC